MLNWEVALRGLPIGAFRYFDSIGSTNDEAIRWAEEGAPDLSIVVADEQTRGRGRFNRRWYTTAGSALAVSIVLKQFEQKTLEACSSLPKITALAALAVTDALWQLYELSAQIKWPNDVLVFDKKICGILAETQWHGDQPFATILGIGINVSRNSLQDAHTLAYPATSLEECLPQKEYQARGQERSQLLRKLIERILFWRPLIHSADFTYAWETRLAFRDKWVLVYQDYEAQLAGQKNHPMEGKILGITNSGNLKLQDRLGKIFTLDAGEIRLHN